MDVHRELTDCLDALRGTHPVILGVGNILKGDDGVGPLVCARLTGKTSATVIDAGTAPENYLRPIIRAKCENLLIVDAVNFAGCPGQVRLFRPDQMSEFAFSTHSLSLHLFLDLLRHDIEVHTLLFGVQPSHTQLGRPVSEPVQASIEVLVETLVAMFPRS